ncbi:Mur ligase middle domain-containing protein [Aminobacter sp. Y103A]|uniref:hypothetical protein n=1 Tax=Aminobacter sp. Y103A TaxID=1870862 RepID=UPI002573A93C|nr:hypothetical protein [Aminobacter sp. SS-2016]BBD39456.1 Mur ligase middle domain-containing protein [Aminobacter sp. SS-2016]
MKAPNDSIPAAIAILRNAQPANKRAVIGFISDYTGGPRKGTALAYDLAYQCSDQFIFVGENGHRARPTAEDRNSGKFIDFLLPKEASDYVKATSRPNELILLKGSQTQHLERIALSWTHDVQCWNQLRQVHRLSAMRNGRGSLPRSSQSPESSFAGHAEQRQPIHGLRACPLAGVTGEAWPSG